MSQVVWLPESLVDIQRLYAFLKDMNQNAAMRAAALIRQGAEMLAQFPEMGQPMGDGTERREVFLSYGAGCYVLRYRVTADGVSVVLRVWHQKDQRKG